MKTICLKIRKNWSFWYLSTILGILFISSNADATIRTVNVSSNQFSPSTVNAFVGDTIRWQWVDGSHTTTSTSVPGGAATWNSPMTSGNPTYMYRITVAGTYQYWCEPHSPDMAGTIVATISGISQEGNTVPSEYGLKQNYPNPFNPATNIKFSIPQGSFVTLKIFNLLGQEVSTLVNGQLQPGNYTYDWDAQNLNSGVYFYRLEAAAINGSEKFFETKRMTLIK